MTVLAAILGRMAAAAPSDKISGIVHNETLGKVAVDDDVVLLRIDATPPSQVEARTRTDGYGSFELPIQNQEKPHLLRVLHAGVAYEKRVTGSTTISLDVYEAAGKAGKISGSLEVIRFTTRQTFLHVSDMIEIRNESDPPVTQTGDQTLQVNAPPEATLDSVLAAGPEGFGRQIAARPVPGKQGIYAVDFPLRPGATRSAFNYDLPYRDRILFYPQSSYGMQLLAVMIPTTMQFFSSSPAFKALVSGNTGYRVETASHIHSGKAPQFEIAGAGEVPGSPTQTRHSTGSTVASSAVSMPQAGNNSRLPPRRIADIGYRPREVMSRFSSPWLLTGAGLFVTSLCGLTVVRSRLRCKQEVLVEKKGSRRHEKSLSLELVKEELLRLEIARLQNTISPEQYQSDKEALQRILPCRNLKANDLMSGD
jgi:hypothetical protein